MNLISCNSCGAVLDKDKITQPDIYTDDGEISMENTIYLHKDYLPAIKCPVCKVKISYIDGDSK